MVKKILLATGSNIFQHAVFNGSGHRSAGNYTGGSALQMALVYQTCRRDSGAFNCAENDDIAFDRRTAFFCAGPAGVAADRQQFSILYRSAFSHSAAAAQYRQNCYQNTAPLPAVRPPG